MPKAFTYAPAPDFEGVDRFTYQVYGADGASHVVPVPLWVGLVFFDGFETGDLTRWTDSNP